MLKRQGLDDLVSGSHLQGAAEVTTGTVETSGGPINWENVGGTLSADGGGQHLVVTGSSTDDGSSQQTSTYQMNGQTYLSMKTATDVPQKTVTTSVEAGASQLTLTLANLEMGVTSPPAFVSGTLYGKTVNWSGTVDLNSNPFVGHAVDGWPIGAFAKELERAAFFNPLAQGLAPHKRKHPGGMITTATTAIADDGTSTRPAGTGTPGVVSIESVGGVIGRAGAWCAGGAVAGSGGAPETLGTSIVLGCVGGAGASLLSDLFTFWLDDAGIDVDPPVVDVPGDPEDPSTSSSSTSKDDPPPDPGDGGGGDGGDDGDAGPPA